MDIEKVLELYDLMANRCEHSGFAPNQAKVYNEMVNFLSDCKTAEEATEKIRNSPYYLAAGAAFIRDKLLSFARAAEELDMPDVAQVYLDKEQEIASDVNMMYVTGYEIKGNNLKLKYAQRREAVGKIFHAYIELLCCTAQSKEVARLHGKLEKAFEELEALGVNFPQIASQKYVRESIPLTDEKYEQFLQQSQQLRITPPANGEAESKGELEAAWNGINQRKADIQILGKTCLPQIGYGECIVVPPDKVPGTYSYTNIVKEG